MLTLTKPLQMKSMSLPPRTLQNQPRNLGFLAQIPKPCVETSLRFLLAFKNNIAREIRTYMDFSPIAQRVPCKESRRQTWSNQKTWHKTNTPKHRLIGQQLLRLHPTHGPRAAWLNLACLWSCLHCCWQQYRYFEDLLRTEGSLLATIHQLCQLFECYPFHLGNRSGRQEEYAHLKIVNIRHG